MSRRTAWDRFRRRRINLVWLGLFVALVVFCVLGPPVVRVVWGWTWELQQVRLGATPPSLAHPFGTDILGRDLMVRTMHGGRASLLLALLATTASLVLGTLYGAASGLSGRFVDGVLMRTLDVLQSLPALLLVIVVVSVVPTERLNLGALDGSFVVMTGVLVAVSWLMLARVVRSQVLVLRERDFVVAARAMGVPPLTILVRHILPNALGAILVYTTLTIPSTLVAEAFLSFLGLGIREPWASWGTLLRDGASTLGVCPWLLLMPSLVMCLTLLTLNLLGDAIRDALDVRTPRGGLG